MIEYTEQYWEKCFQVWFSAGCPESTVKISEIIPDNDDGDRPSPDTIKRAMAEYGWTERADVLNASAIQIAETNLINLKADMLKRQAETAYELQEMALEKLRVDGFDSSASAVNAFIKGAELERESRGLSQSLIRIAKMDDEKLIQEAYDLLKRMSNSVDAEILEEENKDE